MHKPENERIHHNGEDYVPAYWLQTGRDALDRCCGELETAELRVADLRARVAALEAEADDLSGRFDECYASRARYILDADKQAERVEALEAAITAHIAKADADRGPRLTLYLDGKSTAPDPLADLRAALPPPPAKEDV